MAPTLVSAVEGLILVLLQLCSSSCLVSKPRSRAHLDVMSCTPRTLLYHAVDDMTLEGSGLPSGPSWTFSRCILIVDCNGGRSADRLDVPLGSSLVCVEAV